MNFPPLSVYLHETMGEGDRVREKRKKKKKKERSCISCTCRQIVFGVNPKVDVS